MSICPKCQNELSCVEYHDIELLTCANCQGVWFREGKFREVKQIGFTALVEHLPTLEDAPPKDDSIQKELLCPDCSETLTPFTYAYSSDIELHRCNTCQGIWGCSADLLRIEKLLTNYKESLDEAKAKALPLMLKVKKQIRQAERTKEEERKQRKKGMFNRLFKTKEMKNRKKIENIFEDFDLNKHNSEE